MYNDIIIKIEDGKIVINNIANYFSEQGVWALFGKKVDEKDWVCLNVGKNKNVGREILYDVGCLLFVSWQGQGTRNYINYFKEDCGFKYDRGLVQEYLYPHIATQYSDFEFVYVHELADSNFEREFAKAEKALYWRNGRPYKISSNLKKDIVAKSN